MSPNNIYERCFVFSREEMDKIVSLETSNGRPAPKLGTVIVNGVQKQYTSIVTSMDRARYSDSICLIKGDIRTIKYTQPSVK